MPGFADERTAVAIANFDFSKAFNIVSCKMLPEKLMKEELDKQAVRWTEDCLKSQAQKAVISSTQSAHSWLYPSGQKCRVLFDTSMNGLEDGAQCYPQHISSLLRESISNRKW